MDINTLNLLIKHTRMSAVELTGVVTYTARTVNGDALPLLTISADTLHVEANGFWVQIDLRDAKFSTETFSPTMDVVTITAPMFTVRLTLTASN